MTLPIRLLCRHYRLPLARPIKWNLHRNAPLKIQIYSVTSNSHNPSSFSNTQQNYGGSQLVSCKHYGTSTQPQPEKTPEEVKKIKKAGLIQRFKEMARDYWYVLLPVHAATSIIWFGGFYYAVSSGVDVLGWIESLELSDKIMAPLRKSGAGYFALAFACYKVVSPLRYAVTLGGATFAIKKLTTMGWIKPMPSKQRIKEVFKEQKETLQDKLIESKEHYQAHIMEKKAQITEKKTQVIEEMSRYKTELRNIKDRVKKM